MQIICLHAESGHVPLKTAAADLGPIAFVHHGRVAYSLFRAGKSQVVRDYVKKVHDLGLLAGVSIQDPDDLKRITDEGWENEFFMTSFHNLSRPAEEQRRLFGTVAVGEPFLGFGERRLAREVLAMGDVDHFLGDDSGAGEFELGDELAGRAGA